MVKRPSYLRLVQDDGDSKRRALLRECVMIYSGLPIPVRREHVAELVRMWMGKSRTGLCEHCQEALSIVPLDAVKPKYVTVQAARRERRREPRMNEQTVGTIVSVVKTLLAATNDKNNALGTGQQVSSLAAYGSLFWDLFKAARAVPELPAAVRTMTQEDSGPVVQKLTQDLGISSVHAQAVVDAGAKILNHFVQTTVGSVEAMSSAITDVDAAKKLAAAKTQK